MELRRQLGRGMLSHRMEDQAQTNGGMQERDSQYLPKGIIHVDDAYFGVELSGGAAGRGSENKVPFVAAVKLNDEGWPIHIKMDRVSGFTSEAIKAWAKKSVASGSAVFSDGLACFRATAEAGCEHIPEVMGGGQEA